MPLPAISTLPAAPSRNDDGDAFVGKADAFVAALPPFVDEMNTVITAIPSLATEFNTVSTTSVAIGTGQKTFTAEPNRALGAGQWLVIASAADPTNYMIAQVTSYTIATGVLVVNVIGTSGSGTYADWVIANTVPRNAAVNPRAVIAAETLGTITPTADVADLYILTGLTGATTIAAPSGTPANGQKLMLRIKDNGTTRTLSWNAIYRAFGAIVLPANTSAGKDHYVGLIYNSAAAKWDAIAYTVEP